MRLPCRVRNPRKESEAGDLPSGMKKEADAHTQEIIRMQNTD